MIRKDLTNQRFGKLLVIRYFGKANDGHSIWLCQCDCGNTTRVATNSLRNGTKSCGCILTKINKQRNKEKCNFYKHGKTNTRLFTIWHSMKQRCTLPTSEHYKDYGGRGIKVCDEWKDFESFYEWAMANDYKENLTLDRIDNNGNYEPNNCRWTTRKVQANNTRHNHLITYNGETHTISEWSEIVGIRSDTIAKRINKYKWSNEKALTTKGKIRK